LHCCMDITVQWLSGGDLRSLHRHKAAHAFGCTERANRTNKHFRANILGKACSEVTIFLLELADIFFTHPLILKFLLLLLLLLLLMLLLLLLLLLRYRARSRLRRAWSRLRPLS